jgi:hypothetical protein
VQQYQFVAFVLQVVVKEQLNAGEEQDYVKEAHGDDNACVDSKRLDRQ